MHCRCPGVVVLGFNSSALLLHPQSFNNSNDKLTHLIMGINSLTLIPQGINRVSSSSRLLPLTQPPPRAPRPPIPDQIPVPPLGSQQPRRGRSPQSPTLYGPCSRHQCLLLQFILSNTRNTRHSATLASCSHRPLCRIILALALPHCLYLRLLRNSCPPTCRIPMSAICSSTCIIVLPLLFPLSCLSPPPAGPRLPLGSCSPLQLLCNLADKSDGFVFIRLEKA